MCTSHNHLGINRRSFTLAALAGAGLSLAPSLAFAGTTDAMCMMCIDYRIADRTVNYLTSTLGPKKFDLTALAGASLAGVLTTFPDAVPGFWKQIELAIALHHIKKVQILDHMECGAYWAQFNGGNPMPRAVEERAHVQTMAQVKQAFYQRFPATLGLQFFLIDVVNDEWAGIREIPVP